MAEGEYSPLVAGFVSQARPLAGNSTPYALQFTPGVSLNSGTGGDGLGQVYNSVENGRGLILIYMPCPGQILQI